MRLRVDRRLIDHRIVSADLAAPAVSRVKVIANLDLGERRLPQDGRTTFVIGGRQVDVRVATSPTVFGEAAVLRILDRTSVPLDLDVLGLNIQVVHVLRRAAKSPQGMILVTGPTGSGKTTTLYPILNLVNRREGHSRWRIRSSSDSSTIPQTTVNEPQNGLTFANALRSLMRQDPDVILVGEIRDPETADMAVRAAMTGHKVLASIHANDVLAVLPRLQDMGVEPYQPRRESEARRPSGWSGGSARIAANVARPHEAERAFASAVHAETPSAAFDAIGCPTCAGAGFKGRVAIGEAFLANEEILRAVADRSSTREIAALARAAGLASMAVDGVAKAAEGLTTIEEVMAAVHG